MNKELIDNLRIKLEANVNDLKIKYLSAFGNKNRILTANWDVNIKKIKGTEINENLDSLEIKKLESEKSYRTLDIRNEILEEYSKILYLYRLECEPTYDDLFFSMYNFAKVDTKLTKAILSQQKLLINSSGVDIETKQNLKEKVDLSLEDINMQLDLINAIDIKNTSNKADLLKMLITDINFLDYNAIDVVNLVSGNYDFVPQNLSDKYKLILEKEKIENKRR